MSAAAERSSWFARLVGQPPLVVAHRGASGLAPENTLAAFRRALELRAPAVECDVHLSADGVPVVIHDAKVDRTTTGRGEVGALSLAALRGLDAGAWFGPEFAGERIPTLEEVLATCRGRARVVIELKPGGDAPLVEATLQAIATTTAAELAIISFDPQVVRLVAQRAPDLPLGFLLTSRGVAELGHEAVVRETTSLGATCLAPHYSTITAPFVATIHAAGLAVSVWTIDDPTEMERLAGLGVDAITTNRPDVALDVLGRPPTATV
ncbi:MAG TPA: glycerophosphodiester phosphodiesterase family protein [Chloroflexota bacterium]|jgi:glycerophosphoryl diester phosphodiesterase|nr:glycerophosphodiester phosphodiesterase family protein [Chloroflexota bacterium]